MAYDNNPYASSSSGYTYGGSHDASNLQFYSSSSAVPVVGGINQGSNGYYASGGMDTRHSLEGQRSTISGSMTSSAAVHNVASFGASGQMTGVLSQGGFWSAFGTGGFEGEPPLLEELGINFDHIKNKSIAALNPFGSIDRHLMDDADLAGPLLFCFGFGMFLLFSGKPQFGYIYGLALMGDIALYLLLNLMSASGIDAYRVASVLGYCLLPLVLLSLVTVMVSMDGLLGYILFSASILWCSYSASGIFVAVLGMSEQRFLVAYPVGLFYTTFALLSVFDARTGGLGAKG